MYGKYKFNVTLGGFIEIVGHNILMGLSDLKLKL